MARFVNTTRGPRGGYLKGVLVMVRAGEEAELDDAPEEWFAEAKPAKAAPASDKK